MLSITEFDEYLGEVMGIWVMGDGNLLCVTFNWPEIMRKNTDSR